MRDSLKEPICHPVQNFIQGYSQERAGMRNHNIPFTFENCYTGSGTDSFIGTYAGFSEGTYLRSCTEFYTGLFTGTCRDMEPLHIPISKPVVGKNL